MAGVSVRCQTHLQNAAIASDTCWSKCEPCNQSRADSYRTVAATPERLRMGGNTSRRLHRQLGFANGLRVAGLTSAQKHGRVPFTDIRPRKREPPVVLLCARGGFADASAFEPDAVSLPIVKQPSNVEQPSNADQSKSAQQNPEPTKQLNFNPLSLPQESSERPSKLPTKFFLACQLSVAVCIALFIAACDTTPTSNFLSLSLTTSSQTGPSALQSFHPLVQIAWTGLVTGCLHTMTGPDHLASLAPLTIGRSRVQSAALGALWGAGHGSGQLLLGSIFLLFKDKIEHLLPVLSRWSSTLVGLILIVIGAHGVYESLLPIDDDAMEFTSYVGTYVNGFTFGLQPDALMMILPALALPSRASAAIFLGAFLLGTILAMGTYSGCIGAASQALGKRMPWLTQRLSQISGVIAIGLGLFFVVTNVLGL